MPSPGTGDPVARHRIKCLAGQFATNSIGARLENEVRKNLLSASGKRSGNSDGNRKSGIDLGSSGYMGSKDITSRVKGGPFFSKEIPQTL